MSNDSNLFMQSNEKMVQINKTLPKDDNSTIPEEQEDDIELGKRGWENSLIIHL